METDELLTTLAFLLAHIAVCAALFFWFARKDKDASPAVCRAAFPSRGCAIKNKGDPLASRKDWWRWQIYLVLISAVFWLMPVAAEYVKFLIPFEGAGVLAVLAAGFLSAFLTTGIAVLLLAVFVYLGVQRLIAAGLSGWWMFPLLIVAFAGESVGEDSDLYYIIGGYAVSMAVTIFVGVIPDKTETRPAATEAQPAH